MGDFSGRIPQLVAVVVFGGIGLAVYWSQDHAGERIASTKPTTVSVSTAAAMGSGGVPRADSIPDQSPTTAPIAFHRMPPATASAGRAAFTDHAVQEAAAKVKAFPDRPEGYEALTVAFMQKARETADAAYYSRAEAAVGKALQLDPNAYDALRLVPWIYVNQHRFAEAVAAARRAIALKPKDAWNYGTLGDALAELGEYEASAEAIDRMVTLRPDSSSYARVAHQRELRGDTEGAVSTMRMAAEASATGAPENAAWCRVQLANILLNAGRLGEAETEFARALELYPDYYFALAGMGRLKAARGEAEAAIALYRRSLAIAPRHETVVWLGDLLLSLKRPAEAAREFQLLEVIDKILRANGVQPGTQLALFYADHEQQLGKAVEIATASARERKDVRTQDALAWALLKSGRAEEAAVAMQQALRLGTRDASFHFHAGVIEAKRGHSRQAIVALRLALEINPSFDIRHADEARALLAELGDVPATAASALPPARSE